MHNAGPAVLEKRALVLKNSMALSVQSRAGSSQLPTRQALMQVSCACCAHTSASPLYGLPASLRRCTWGQRQMTEPLQEI